MNPKREQALVGLFVLIAVGILIAAVLVINGTFGRTAKLYHARFQFAGGLEPGATVRYSGGPKIGRVENLGMDLKDPSLIDLTFSVRSDLNVKTDSKVRIMSMSPLGDNHLELLPGSGQAGNAPEGSLLASENYTDFNAIADQINNIAPQAQQLLHDLDDRTTQLRVTLARVNDLLNNQNRSNLAATLAETRGMIADSRPQVRSALEHVNTLGAKLEPLIEDFRKDSAEASDVLTHVDAMVGEERPEVHKAVSQLQDVLRSMNELAGRLNQTMDVNSESIDQLLDNMVHVTENLKEFTETIKTRPYTLIRSSSPPEHKTGGQK
jgi:phospholipid/cholesterol/gamma-HCH transport system substrate-binding protein